MNYETLHDRAKGHSFTVRAMLEAYLALCRLDIRQRIHLQTELAQLREAISMVLPYDEQEIQDCVELEASIRNGVVTF